MPRRVLEGNVVSDKTDKTITVLVERRLRHPVYKKYVRRTDKYAAHDENNQFKVGDRVSIIECRPISKTKRWTVLGPEAGNLKPEKKAAEPKAEKRAAEKKSPAKEPAAKKKMIAKKTKKKKDA